MQLLPRQRPLMQHYVTSITIIMRLGGREGGGWGGVQQLRRWDQIRFHHKLPQDDGWIEATIVSLFPEQNTHGPHHTGTTSWLWNMVARTRINQNTCKSSGDNVPVSAELPVARPWFQSLCRTVVVRPRLECPCTTCITMQTASTVLRVLVMLQEYPLYRPVVSQICLNWFAGQLTQVS